MGATYETFMERCNKLVPGASQRVPRVVLADLHRQAAGLTAADILLALAAAWTPAPATTPWPRHEDLP